MSNYRTPEAAHEAHVTYHLSPREVWEAQQAQPEYLPEAFAQDGFIHCTDGLDRLVEIANMFYTGDPREYVTLILDTEKLTSRVQYDDPDQHFPHIYGPLNTDAVIGQLKVTRGEDGTFLTIGD